MAILFMLTFEYAMLAIYGTLHLLYLDRKVLGTWRILKISLPNWLGRELYSSRLLTNGVLCVGVLEALSFFLFGQMAPPVLIAFLLAVGVTLTNRSLNDLRHGGIMAGIT